MLLKDGINVQAPCEVIKVLGDEGWVTVRVDGHGEGEERAQHLLIGADVDLVLDGQEGAVHGEDDAPGVVDDLSSAGALHQGV